MTPLTVKLRTAALADPNLTGQLVGSGFTGVQAPFNGSFRWYDRQLWEGSPYPAVTVMQVSGVPYQASYRNPVSKYRTQFMLWEGPTPDIAGALLTAIQTFMDSFSAAQAGQRSLVIDVRDGFYAATQPGIYQRIVDAYIFSDDTT
jgi:hypothetical protein